IIFVIIASAILSFIVLYLLNSTNIKERMRELATLKVLGLYDKDVSAYVYRENIIFTIISIPIGFLIGKVLHKIIVTTIVIEAVTLSQSVSLISYGLSVLLMLSFSLIVNITMHRYLKKIDMVESLKSVE
ncbi:MAG TPA: ABC transporter permease, partial [Clostridia bacterium]|nr:ABC transporter permease [Clostridia bacterium]